MSDIFLSYKRSRRPVVERLATALKMHGWDVWFDAHLTEGEQFRKEIERELEGSRCAVVLWCDQSLVSDFVLDEASWAKTQGVLVQARWQDVQVPLGFGQHQSVDLIGWDRGLPQLTKLITAIEKMIGVPGEPTRGPMGRPTQAKVENAIELSQIEDWQSRAKALEKRLESESKAREAAEIEAGRLRREIEQLNSPPPAVEEKLASRVRTPLLKTKVLVDVAERVLSGRSKSVRQDLMGAFLWFETPQGGSFWDKATSGDKLSPEGAIELRKMVDEARVKLGSGGQDS